MSRYCRSRPQTDLPPPCSRGAMAERESVPRIAHGLGRGCGDSLRQVWGEIVYEGGLVDDLKVATMMKKLSRGGM